MSYLVDEDDDDLIRDDDYYEVHNKSNRSNAMIKNDETVRYVQQLLNRH